MIQTATVIVSGSPMEILYAAPAEPGRHPGIVVAHHRPGLDAFTTDALERLAAQGYVAAAPSLYHRRPKEEHTGKAREYMTDAEIIADLAATASFLEARSDVRADALGILGHCMGGRISFLGAAVDRRYKVAGVFYGGNIMQAWGDGPPPYARAIGIGCPVYGFFGNDDGNPSPADVAKIDAELKRLNIPHVFHGYPGAGHAFQSFERADAYRKDASEDAWGKLFVYLDRELKARKAA
jgi:carboxymethylenebutenolidase